jgi:hypothetical protein
MLWKGKLQVLDAVAIVDPRKIVLSADLASLYQLAEGERKNNLLFKITFIYPIYHFQKS